LAEVGAFCLGNKNAAMTAVFDYDPVFRYRLNCAVHAPSLCDELLRYLAPSTAMRGFRRFASNAISPCRTKRNAELIGVFKRIYENTNESGRLSPARTVGRGRRGKFPALAIP
jgi:tryptophan 2,3-dioxygenase